MKAVLISIKPKWCELIAQGKKIVEVRKTKPKIDAPFKCYIFCTKSRTPYESFGVNKQPIECGGKVIGFIACMMCIFKVGKQADYYSDIYEERKSYREYDKGK